VLPGIMGNKISVKHCGKSTIEECMLMERQHFLYGIEISTPASDPSLEV
jgi:hypothetical protein